MSSLSFKIGKILYKHCFPVYNIVYPVFKRRQDALEISLIKKMVRKGDVVLDIGANIGFYTKILSELTGTSGAVHAFEPDPENFMHLEDNAGGIPNVTLVPRAVSETTGKLKIYTSKILNVDHRTYPVDDYDKIIEIDAISIDDYIHERFAVNFIKMDIQGAELWAMKGMRKTLERNPGAIILTELWPYGFRSAGVSAGDFFDYITGSGLEIFSIGKKKITPFKKSDIQGISETDSNDYINIIICKNEAVLMAKNII